eukprot:PhF_6_TR39763/c0_g1_i1/m.59165
MSFTPGGGGISTSNVGTPGAGLHTRKFDELTRRMTRQDLMNFIMDEKNLTPIEKQLIEQTFMFSFGGMIAAGGITYGLTSYLPWRHFKPYLPFAKFVVASRVTLSLAAASIPFAVGQQWGLQQILALPEDSNLAFNTRRYLMTQQGNIMFSRTQAREIPKEELIASGAVGADPRNANMQMPDPRGGINPEYTLQQQQLVPIAQTGYKAAPPK